MDTRRSAAIAIGAVVGAGLRWSLAEAMGPGGVDAALLCVNLFGAALLAALTSMRTGSLDPRLEALLGAGFCGALTTWSSLALRTASRYHDGVLAAPTLWLLANLVGVLGIVVLIRSVWGPGAGSDPAGTSATRP